MNPPDWGSHFCSFMGFPVGRASYAAVYQEHRKQGSETGITVGISTISLTADENGGVEAHEVCTSKIADWIRGF